MSRVLAVVYSAPVEQTLQAVRSAELVGCAWVVLSALPRWRRTRERAPGWVLAMFTVLGAIVAAGWWSPTDTASAVVQWADKLLVAALLVFPYLLFRFTRSLLPARPALERLMTVVTVAVVVWTLALPPFPQPSQSRPAWLWAYVGAVLLAWATVSAASAGPLWAAGRGQPTVVRRRLRLLSAGAVILSVTLIGAGLSPGGNQAASAVASGLAGLVGLAAFFLAFALPGFLRTLWRTGEEAALATAQAGLIAARTAQEVGQIVTPRVARLLGGSAAVLADSKGEAVTVEGMGTLDVAAVTAWSNSPERSRQPIVRLSPNLIVAPMLSGCLAVRMSPFIPFFGPEELLLLQRVSQYADLALQRLVLQDHERESRQALGRAKEELESLVYGLSHDLKSPLISILGYLDCLREDYGDDLADGARHYLNRMSANVAYMQELIGALLEVSRVGRFETDVASVPLRELLDQVGEEMGRAHDSAHLEVGGAVPEVRMSRLRARQLFTNLIENALRHSGRPDVTVVVQAHALPDGSAAVSVSDNGPGIPAQYRDKVFGIFERLEASTEGTKGTGVGLTVCKRIMEALDGSIQIEDAGGVPGTGARFVLVFPPAVVERWSSKVKELQ